MRASLLRAVPLAIVTSTIGCAAPYRFVAHAEPNPFVRPGCRAVVEPLHVDRLVVGDKPIAQYAADKKAESADSFDEDLRAADVVFHQRVIDEHGALFLPGTPDNTFIIRPVFAHWEPGFYAYVAAHPSEAELLVDVLAPNGQLLDRIDVTTRVSASMFNPSSGGRMREALKQAGHDLDIYISDNWLCAGQ